MQLEIVGFCWSLLPDVRRKRVTVPSEKGQEEKKKENGVPYVDGCIWDVCTTRWVWNPLVSHISMIRTAECCETVSETA